MERSPNSPSLFDAINLYKQISVEDYQRTYQWTQDEVSDFVTDVFETAESKENHFFGTLIVEHNSKSGNNANLVDGQQRLTTAFIFVSALRDIIAKRGEEKIDGDAPGELPIDVMGEAWKFLYFSNKTSDLRLVPNRFIRDFFANYVVAEPSDTRKNLPKASRTSTLPFRKAVWLIQEKLEAKFEGIENKVEVSKLANQLLDVFFNKFIILKIDTKDRTESLEVFLTMNNRGLPLGPSDLVRGIIMSIQGEGLEPAQQAAIHTQIFTDWESATELVKEPEVFLRHYLVAHSKDKIQKKKIVETIENKFRIENLGKKRKEATDFWNDLINSSEIYGKLVDPSSANDIDKSVAYDLELLGGLTKSHRILLMKLLPATTSVVEQRKLTRTVLVFVYHWFMAGKNSQVLEDFLQDLCWKHSAGTSISQVIDLIKLKDADSNVDVDKYLRTDGDSSFITRALLHSIDRIVANGAIQQKLRPNPDQFPARGNLQLEHVAPQSPNDHWRIALFGNKDVSPDDYEAAISIAGNLTLLDDKLNAAAQTAAFAKKVADHYKKSVMYICRDLTDLPEWNLETIESRHLWLVEMFEKVFSFEPKLNEVTNYTAWLESNAEA